jgi:hypothetical protein
MEIGWEIVSLVGFKEAAVPKLVLVQLARASRNATKSQNVGELYNVPGSTGTFTMVLASSGYFSRKKSKAIGPMILTQELLLTVF